MYFVIVHLVNLDSLNVDCFPVSTDYWKTCRINQEFWSFKEGKILFKICIYTKRILILWEKVAVKVKIIALEGPGSGWVCETWYNYLHIYWGDITTRAFSGNGKGGRGGSVTFFFLNLMFSSRGFSSVDCSVEWCNVH